MTRLAKWIERHWHGPRTRQYDQKHHGRPVPTTHAVGDHEEEAMSNISKPVGFRRTQPFMGNPTGIGWAFWIGPLVVSRLQPWQGKRLHFQRLTRYVGVSALGVCVSVSR